MKISRGRLQPAIQTPAKLIRAGTALLCTVSPLHHHARGCRLPCMHSERQAMSAHRPALWTAPFFRFPYWIRAWHFLILAKPPRFLQ